MGATRIQTRGVSSAGLQIANMLAADLLYVTDDGTNVTYGIDTTGADPLAILTSVSGTPTWLDATTFLENIYTADGSIPSGGRTVTLTTGNLTFDMTSTGRTYLGAHEFRGDVNIVELGRLDANAGANLLVGIDFCSTTGDNNARIIRNGGTDGSFAITNLGTGNMTMNTVNGNMFLTASNENITLTAGNILTFQNWINVNGTSQYRLLTPTTVPNGTTTYVVNVDALNGQRLTFGASHPGCVLQWQATDARWGNTNTQEYVLFIENNSSNNITFDTAFYDGATSALGTGQHVVKCQYDPETNKFFVFQPSAGGGSATPGGSTTQMQYNNAGAFDGTNNLTWDNATDTLSASTSVDIDFGDAQSFELPNGSTENPSIIGQIALDTAVTNFSGGVIRYRDSVEQKGIVAMPSTQFSTAPLDNEVVTYDASTNDFILQVVPLKADLHHTNRTSAISSAVPSEFVWIAPPNFVGRTIRSIRYGVNVLPGRTGTTQVRMRKFNAGVVSFLHAGQTLSGTVYYTDVTGLSTVIATGDMFYIDVTNATSSTAPEGLYASMEIY